MEKKTSCLLCVLTALLLTMLYLWAALRPGVWLRDAFLYRQADGSFSGKDAYAAYTMQVAQTENGAEVEFTMDGETRHYRLESKAEGMSDPGVKIEQDGVVIFTGTALGDPGDAILWREDDGGLADEVNVIVNGEYQRSDLWPSCNWLYNVAVGGRRETRGSMAFLLPIGALAVRRSCGLASIRAATSSQLEPCMSMASESTARTTHHHWSPTTTPRRKATQILLLGGGTTLVRT
jgi:hypothetical protein